MWMCTNQPIPNRHGIKNHENNCLILYISYSISQEICVEFVFTQYTLWLLFSFFHTSFTLFLVLSVYLAGYSGNTDAAYSNTYSVYCELVRNLTLSSLSNHPRDLCCPKNKTFVFFLSFALPLHFHDEDVSYIYCSLYNGLSVLAVVSHVFFSVYVLAYAQHHIHIQFNKFDPEKFFSMWPDLMNENTHSNTKMNFQRSSRCEDSRMKYSMR